MKIDFDKFGKNEVHQIFNEMDKFEWSIQGFGFMRTYLDDDEIHRLHIWTNEYRVKNVSDIHDHPWDFESKIIAGVLINNRYKVTPDKFGSYKQQKIRPGAAKMLGEPTGCSLDVLQKETYFEGGRYSQKATEVHRTELYGSAISIIKRDFIGDREQALSYYKADEKWVDAKPRPATRKEAWNIICESYKRFIM